MALRNVNYASLQDIILKFFSSQIMTSTPDGRVFTVSETATGPNVYRTIQSALDALPVPVSSDDVQAPYIINVYDKPGGYNENISFHLNRRLIIQGSFTQNGNWTITTDMMFGFPPGLVIQGYNSLLTAPGSSPGDGANLNGNMTFQRGTNTLPSGMQVFIGFASITKTGNFLLSGYTPATPNPWSPPGFLSDVVVISTTSSNFIDSFNASNQGIMLSAERTAFNTSLELLTYATILGCALSGFVSVIADPAVYNLPSWGFDACCFQTTVGPMQLIDGGNLVPFYMDDATLGQFYTKGWTASALAQIVPLAAVRRTYQYDSGVTALPTPEALNLFTGTSPIASGSQLLVSDVRAKAMNLQVYVTPFTVGVGNSTKVVLSKNGAATPLTVTISDTATYAENVIDVVDLVQGDFLLVQVEAIAGVPAATKYLVSFDMVGYQ